MEGEEFEAGWWWDGSDAGERRGDGGVILWQVGERGLGRYRDRGGRCVEVNGERETGSLEEGGDWGGVGLLGHWGGVTYYVLLDCVLRALLGGCDYDGDCVADGRTMSLRDCVQ